MNNPQPPSNPVTHHVAGFFVAGQPAPQGSKSGFIRGEKVVMVEVSKKVKPWRKEVSTTAKDHFPQPWGGPIHLYIEFILKRTLAMKDKPAPPMVQRPDLDKLLRSTLDGLSDIAFHDDSQVTHITAFKRRAKPGEATGAYIQVAKETANDR